MAFPCLVKTIHLPALLDSSASRQDFLHGPSSMEGDLHIHPGDWISGGYNFKFVSGSHAATSYSVTATVTLPVTCPDNSLQNIVVILGAPGELNGGGVSTYTYSIPANDRRTTPRETKTDPGVGRRHPGARDSLRRSSGKESVCSDLLRHGIAGSA